MVTQADSPQIEPTSRTRVRRRAGRGGYERRVVNAILDEGLVAHVGICDADGQPFVIPVFCGRHETRSVCTGVRSAACCAP